MPIPELDIALVPEGLYCHRTGGGMEVCTFWGPGPDPADGYCHLLGFGDADMEERSGDCRLLWSSFRPVGGEGCPPGTGGRLSVGTLSRHGKECGLNAGAGDSTTHSLRMPNLGVVRHYDSGIPLRDEPLDPCRKEPTCR